jgi:hypothetical protein
MCVEKEDASESESGESGDFKCLCRYVYTVRGTCSVAEGSGWRAALAEAAAQDKARLVRPDLQCHVHSGNAGRPEAI